MARRQRRLAAQFDLDRWGKPAQVVIGIVAFRGDEERGFAEVILLGNRLHDMVGQPLVQRHDRRRVAGERAGGEGIDLEEGQSGGHGACSVSSDGRRVSRSTCPSGSTWMRISVPGKRTYNCYS